jgi:hypothetical protein
MRANVACYKFAIQPMLRKQLGIFGLWTEMAQIHAIGHHLNFLVINTSAHEWQSVTPVKCNGRTYSQRVQGGSSPAGSSASGSDGAITLQMGGDGRDWQVMGQRMITSISELSTLVQSVKEEQAGQALILGILGGTAKANTAAIETIQASQAAAMTKQQEFIDDLQRVREMAESANQKAAQLLASPGKDPKKGGRQ